MTSVSCNNYRCEQLQSLIKNVKSKTRKRLVNECLVGGVQMETKEVTQKLNLKDRSCKIRAKYLSTRVILLKKEESQVNLFATVRLIQYNFNKLSMI
jgi:hypothetical protein